MKNSLLPAVALSFSAFAILLISSSGAYGQPRPGGSRAGKNGTATNETYMVIQIGDEIKVVSNTQYKDEDKRVKEENKQKMTEWKDELKNDPKAPRPQNVVIKKLKTGYKLQKIAQEYADKLNDEVAGSSDPSKPKNAAK